MNDAAAQYKKRHHDDQGCQRGQDRSAQRLINASIDDKCQRLFMIFSHVFPDAFKDDDGIA